jgi:hypothetical protein
MHPEHKIAVIDQHNSQFGPASILPTRWLNMAGGWPKEAQVGAVTVTAQNRCQQNG